MFADVDGMGEGEEWRVEGEGWIENGQTKIRLR